MKTLFALVFGFGLVLSSLADPTNNTASASNESLKLRSYNIKADKFVQNLKRLTPPKANESNQDLLKRFLKENHLEIQSPSVVFLDEKKDRLLVRATKANQNQIEPLIEKIINADWKPPSGVGR